MHNFSNSGSFQLVPQMLNNLPLVDIYMNRKLCQVNKQACAIRVRAELVLVLLSQWEKLSRSEKNYA